MNIIRHFKTLGSEQLILLLFFFPFNFGNARRQKLNKMMLKFIAEL